MLVLAAALQASFDLVERRRLSVAGLLPACLDAVEEKQALHRVLEGRVLGKGFDGLHDAGLRDGMQHGVGAEGRKKVGTWHATAKVVF
jgi:hypothetical protein